MLRKSAYWRSSATSFKRIIHFETESSLTPDDFQFTYSIDRWTKHLELYLTYL